MNLDSYSRNGILIRDCWHGLGSTTMQMLLKKDSSENKDTMIHQSSDNNRDIANSICQNSQQVTTSEMPQVIQ